MINKGSFEKKKVKLWRKNLEIKKKQKEKILEIKKQMGEKRKIRERVMEPQREKIERERVFREREKREKIDLFEMISNKNYMILFFYNPLFI